MIKLIPKSNKSSEQLRSMDDYDLDCFKLFEAIKSDKVKEVKYYTEIGDIDLLFKDRSKFKKINIDNPKTK